MYCIVDLFSISEDERRSYNLHMRCAEVLANAPDFKPRGLWDAQTCCKAFA